MVIFYPCREIAEDEKGGIALKKLVLRLLTVALSVVIFASMATVAFADQTLIASTLWDEENPVDGAISFQGCATDGKQGIINWARNNYVVYHGIDMTGVNSVRVAAYVNMESGMNGESIEVKVDDPDGEILGYVTFNHNSDGTAEEFMADITPVSGKHDLYLTGSYSSAIGSYITVKRVTLSSTRLNLDPARNQVPDSAIVDNFHDTWAAADEMGRKVADYEEAGPVKEGKHDLGVLYWNWFVSEHADIPHVTTDILKVHPEIKNDYSSTLWDIKGLYYWAEPIFGFYTSHEYWMYRRHAEMFANAGVDFIMFDYSNGGKCFTRPMTILVQAFRDAKREGVAAPRFTMLTSMSGAGDDALRAVKTMYINYFVTDNCMDVWYLVDGKPVMFPSGPQTVLNKNGGEIRLSAREKALFEELVDFFTVRNFGARGGGPNNEEDPSWLWLEDFPIHAWHYLPSEGRYEFCVVGTAINESSIYKLAATGLFSDEFAKGRGYSEVFGEDFSENGKRMAYFFRDQSSMALDIDPEIILVDGWNEWSTVRNANYNGYINSFVDNFDDENSRDFEPSKGVLRDDYYNLLIDFGRKYKGVRKAPVASGAKTIDVYGAVSQWDTVGPEFICYPVDSNGRDAYSYWKAEESWAYTPKERWHYTAEVYNNLIGAKVSYDNDNLYFLVKAKNNIVTGHDGCMNLFIDVDRNRATGWYGYDYAVNANGFGKLSESTGATWGWKDITSVAYAINGEYMTVSVPRSALGETEAVDLEFKWTDAVDMAGDILNIYEDGSAAPPAKFNYIYTVNEQHHLSDADILGSEAKTLLSGTAILKEDATKMSVGTATEQVYEPDITVTPFMVNGIMYIPTDAVNEIIGYGKSKTWHDELTNTFHMMKYTLERDTSKAGAFRVATKDWLFTTPGSYEMKLNSRTATLTAPVRVLDGIFCVPVDILSDAFGYGVRYMTVDEKTVVVIDKAETHPSEATVNTVCTYLG